MVVVVSDTSTLSALIVVDRLDVLKSIYSHLLIPPAVHAELLTLAQFEIDLSVYLAADWIQVAEPQDRGRVEELRTELDLGEAEAISLALEREASMLIIDETTGRAVALKLGIPIKGLLGILIEAKIRGELEVIKPLLDRLINEANFRVASSLYERVLRTVGEAE